MFPCSGCGLCCKNITNIQELKKFDLGNGVCKYFDHNRNECIIYDNRPDICRVDKMFDLVYHKNFTRERFYIENAKVCNILQEKYEMDKRFRVIIGE
jgi:Fe-S-cluster containining protein